MSKDTNSRGAPQPELSEPFVPDVYYFPIQVNAELEWIQGNLLGKVLTLIETLGLTEKQEKATKDLIRTVIKEQMIKTRRTLDERLDTVLRLGMKPVEIVPKEVSTSFFVTSYSVQPIYDTEKSVE